MKVMVTDPARDDLLIWARTVDTYPPTDWQETLARLQQSFGTKYAIRRLPNFWMAVDKDPETTTEPTVIEETVEALVNTLSDPGPRYGIY